MPMRRSQSHTNLIRSFKSSRFRALTRSSDSLFCTASLDPVQRYIDFLGCANAPISFGVSPLEGFGLFVVATDVADEFPIKIFNRDEDAAGDDITLDFGKPDLNLVEPGGVGWCVMDANITISLQEFPDLGGTMSREIIGDDMNLLWRGLASNELLEKSHELGASMAGRGSAEDFTTLGVERRKERKRPVPIIFKTVPLCAPWTQGQHRIQPIQCLNGTFLVDAEHRCIDRRLEIQTDDIGGFFLELRIIT